MDTLSSSNFEKSRDTVTQFRAKARPQQSLHLLERALLVVVATHLAFLPWAFGGMREWSQWTSLAFSLAAIVLALWPRHYESVQRGECDFRVYTWPKLIRFPIFWLGLTLLTYITIGALNPAWTYETDGKFFWMRAAPHITWLPTGVHVPLAMWGPWRMLIIYTSTWLSICSVWIGITHHRSLRLLLITLAANAIGLAVLGLAQKLTSNGHMFWLWRPPVWTFFSTFIYKNHAGAYLCLGLACTCGIAMHWHFRGLIRREKSDPSILFVFFSVVIAIAIFISGARGATIMMMLLACAILCALIFWKIQHRSLGLRLSLWGTEVAIFFLFVCAGFYALSGGASWKKLAEAVLEKNGAIYIRQRATAAAIEMLGDNWKAGAGSGSFQFLFTTYQQRHPEIVTLPDRGRVFWEHAHNDIVEIAIELGLFGTLCVTASFLYLLNRCIKNRFWRYTVPLCLVSSSMLTLAYAWWDFPLQCPAILITWWILLLVANRWSEIDAGSKRRQI